MKRVFIFVLACVCFLSIPTLFKQITCGFKIAKLSQATSYTKEWDLVSDLSEEELYQVLSQPFVYLDRGAQSYVFSSQDDRYVLKLYRIPRGSSLSSLFSASILAYKKAKEETGLMFVHLNRTENTLPTITVRAPTGRTFQIALDHYHFALQKKAVPFQKALAEARSSGDAALVQKRLDAWVHLLDGRIAKGIYNTDTAFYRNGGFLGDKAIEIDFGNYVEGVGPKEVEREKHFKRFEDWLKGLGVHYTKSPVSAVP